MNEKCGKDVALLECFRTTYSDVYGVADGIGCDVAGWIPTTSIRSCRMSFGVLIRDTTELLQ
jgi:hypothetical protein